MKNDEGISPAFESIRSAATFALVLLFFIALPVILLGLRRPLPEQVYTAVPHAVGPFGYFKQATFDEKGPIDVLFINTSLGWNDIDARVVKDALSAKLGREAVVMNFGSNWRGEEVYYTLFREISARRQIKLVVFNMPMFYQTRNEPHQKAHFWLLFGRDPGLTEGLSLRRRLQLYALNVQGAPRHLLGMARPDFALLTGGENFGSWPVSLMYDRSPFQPQSLPVPHFTPDEATYSLKDNARAKVAGPPIGDYQSHFLRKLFDLAHRKGVPAATIYLPLHSKRALDIIEDREYWPDFTPDPLTMIGIPNARLFAGLTEDQIKKMYYDDHMNTNGMAYFTSAILPGILKAYDNATSGRPPAP